MAEHFLSVYTPTFKRPRMLAQCKQSVWHQTRPVEHVIVPDDVGIGIDGMFADIRNHVDEVHGHYVMVLSDDNVLLDECVAEEMELACEGFDTPDVLVFKGEIVGIMPSLWEVEPVLGRIDLSCFAVKRDVWVQHCRDWGERYEGDFDFIHALWRAGRSFAWWDRVCFKALQISRGLPE